MRKKKISVKKYFLSVVMVISVALAGAQDPHFTQYYASPNSMNPSLLGFGNSDWKVSAIYRSQWWGGNISPYVTSGIAFEKSLASANTNNWGVGLSMLSDASNSGLLKNNYFNAGVAYQMDLAGDGTQTLGLGVSATYANRILDASKFAFQDQFGSMGFQRSIPTADPVSLLNNHYWDLNAGIHYDKTDNAWGYGIGAAVFHAASPEEAVYNNSTYSIARRVVLHGGIQHDLSSGDQLGFSCISEWQGKNNILTLGAQYNIHVNSEILERVHLGLFKRFNDAVCPYAGLESRNWLFGLSYDFVSSNVRSPYNAVQSLELSFGWLLGKKQHLNRERIVHY